MRASEYLDHIASVFLGVEGIHRDAVYSAGGGTVPGVNPLPDNLAEGPVPAVVVLDGERSIIAGGHERTTWAAEGTVWVPDLVPRAEAWRTLLDLEEPIRDAFRNNDHGAIPDPAVQSVLVTTVGRITGRQWMQGEGQPWFLVLPVTFELKYHRAVRYQQV